MSIPKNTYLFAWNPKKWKWKTLEQSIEQLHFTGRVTEDWSCKSHRTIKPGNRAFFVRVGSEPKGIFAAGYILSKPFLSRHWSGENKNEHYVLIEFEVLLNSNKEPILTLDILKSGNLGKQQWTPQSSGISIKPELVDELEALWFDFLITQKIRQNPYVISENETQMTFTEGNVDQVTLTRYERNPYARKVCIEHYGYFCSVCNFNFEQHYGQIGNNFIHVHHLTRIATREKHIRLIQ